MSCGGLIGQNMGAVIPVLAETGYRLVSIGSVRDEEKVYHYILVQPVDMVGETLRQK